MIVPENEDSLNVICDIENQITIKGSDDDSSVCVFSPENLVSTKLGPENVVKVVSSVSNDNLTTNLNQLEDLNLSGLEDGNILVYNSTSQVWENLDEIDGGDY